MAFLTRILNHLNEIYYIYPRSCMSPKITRFKTIFLHFAHDSILLLSVTTRIIFYHGNTDTVENTTHECGKRLSHPEVVCIALRRVTWDFYSVLFSLTIERVHLYYYIFTTANSVHLLKYIMLIYATIIVSITSTNTNDFFLLKCTYFPGHEYGDYALKKMKSIASTTGWKYFWWNNFSKENSEVS